MNHTALRQKILLVIFGLILSAVIIEISLRVAGFIYLSLQEHRNRISLNQKGQYRILCLGESTTAMGGESSYPRQLERVLNQRIPSMQFKAIKEGTPAANTTSIVVKLEDNLEKYKPHIVIVMMGINDNEDIFLYGEGFFPRITTFIANLRFYKLAKLLRAMIFKSDFFHEIYLMIGEYYQQDELHPVEAEEIFKKAIELAPNNDRYRYYIALGWCYNDQGKYIQAEEMFKKSIEVNPKVDITYFVLGQYYQEHQHYAEAEEIFKKAIELAPNNDRYRYYIALGWCYNDQGKYIQAEEMFKKSREINPKAADITYLGYIRYYQERREYSQAEEVFKEVREIIRKIDRSNKITRRNYQKLRDIVLKRGIKLVCVQYPMRNLEPLKTMFDSVKGITFVDNERVFKEALQNGKYEDYFIDRFGGDFGHCTPKGNSLLANNIAEVILKEYFNK